MSEGAAKIVRLERRVMWRKRLLSLQDGLAFAVMLSGLIAAGLVVLLRRRPIAVPLWAVIIGAMSLTCAAVLTRWFFTRSRQSDAAFLIDESLKLDDRIVTSRLIIERGGPKSAFEEALIEDAAARLGDQSAASVVPFRIGRWYALSLASVIGLAAALMIPIPAVPINQALAAERADIESAGEQLEQTSDAVEEAAPLGSETATLAKEQADLGRAFRRSPSTRAEALRRLSALEERIRERHDDLASTRADEIVSLADRRLGSALSTLSASRRTKIEQDESQRALSADGPSGPSKHGAGKDARSTTPSDPGKPLQSSQQNASKPEAAVSRTKPSTKGEQATAGVTATDGQRQSERQKRQQEPISGKGNRNAGLAETKPINPDSKLAKEAAGEPGAATDQKPSNQDPGDTKAGGVKTGDQNIDERTADHQQSSDLPAGSPDALKSVPAPIAEQAAKALPNMSEELLKKAAELRANELSPADVETLRKAAEFLSRDLVQIAQSKELQKALLEMARQIRPEQIEQVARELGNQEKLKQELQAAARLLSENQQAKEIAAGLAEQFARLRDERRRQDNGRQSSGKTEARDEGGARAGIQPSPNTRANRGRASGNLEVASEKQLAGQGRESRLKGTLRQGSGGEYLYLQSKAGVGAARASYSSAYPHYRREAERSVQRSQVPPNLRSVVRKYFDAINPDAKRP